jgi:hypothetical protein
MQRSTVTCALITVAVLAVGALGCSSGEHLFHGGGAPNPDQHHHRALIPAPSSTADLDCVEGPPDCPKSK